MGNKSQPASQIPQSQSSDNASLPSFSAQQNKKWDDDDPIELKRKEETKTENKDESQVLPIMVSLKTAQIDDPEENENSFKPGIDIVCVIDTSGSMCGEKIDLVKKTLDYIIDLLGENDRFSLISFESSATRLSPLLRITKSNKSKLSSIFKKIAAGGGTEINSGMSLALKTLKERKIANHVSSIFLLSDGQDGGADNAIKKSLKQFHIEDTFTIHTFGFGTDHDAKLMKAIANLKDGNFYYIETLDIVNECFVDALGGLISIIAQNVKLSCKLIKHPVFSDMRISKTYDNWQYDEKNQEYYIMINQLLGGVSKDNVFEVNIPPIKKELQDNQKNLEILSLKVEYCEINQQESKKTNEFKLSVQFFNKEDKFEQEKADKDVSINYLRVKGAEAIEEANKKAEKGQYENAQNILNDALKILSSSEYIEEPCLKVLANDLKSAKDACESSNYSRYGANLMVQKTNVHMFQQSAPMQSNEVQCCEEQMNLYSNNMQTKMRSKAREKKF